MKTTGQRTTPANGDRNWQWQQQVEIFKPFPDSVKTDANVSSLVTNVAGS
jgi:hypothetical protein